jgi:2-polyprenyl-3-methyl-5-hydroxy-6-metoxy-1,4-benzoquinol methylase
MNLPIDEAPIPQDLALRQISEIVENRFRGKNTRIYEAGGGSVSFLPLSSLDHPIITVVDIDETQLRSNAYASNKILGDIQTYSFPSNSFDLIACCNVIEHLDRPDQAITRFYHALAPGGLLFIAAPNPESLSGIVTRYTPHWFHVWFSRVIYRNKNAGQPGHHPFPTVFHRVVSPKALLDFCEKLGFEVIHFKQFMGVAYSTIRKTRPVLGGLLSAATSVMNGLMLGRRDLRLGDYHAVLRKSAVTDSFLVSSSQQETN